MGLREGLSIGVLVTIAFVTTPQWLGWYTFRLLPETWRTDVNWEWYGDVLQMLFALLLVLSTPRRSGLRIGRIRQHWWKVLIVCGGIPLVWYAVMQFLPPSPFEFITASHWIVSPGAQELVFTGYLYGHFERVTTANVYRRIPIRGALVLTALFFSLWHVQNFLWLPAGWISFQLGYTFVGMMIYGLSRQWTGSAFYCFIPHMIVNAL